uniref:Threonylcarbamoyl-AMP synthase n=1 Tax=Hirondellea gigas TaxID=1518452 RepID=A0A2P2I8J1_9CRUS
MHVLQSCCGHFLTRCYSSSGKFAVAAVCGMPAVVKLADGALCNHISSAAQILKSGGIVALPTDTLYGLAGLAQHATAVHDIYKVKCRNQAKPLAVCVAQVEDIYKWAEVTVPRELLVSLLPGPVTLIFKRTKALNKELNPETELVGIRIPDSDFIRKVTFACGAPLALTSANISNQQSPLEVEEFKELWPEVAGIFDGGRIKPDFLDDTSDETYPSLENEILSNIVLRSAARDPNKYHNKLTLSEDQKVRTIRNPSREGSTVVDLSVEGFFKIVRQGIALHNTVNVLNTRGLKLLL